MKTLLLLEVGESDYANKRSVSVGLLGCSATVCRYRRGGWAVILGCEWVGHPMTWWRWDWDQ